MKMRWLVTLLALAVVGFGCGGCEQEKPPEPKPKIEKKVEVKEEPKEDPLKEATENANELSTASSVYVSDRAREIAAEFEAAAKKPVTQKSTKPKAEPLTGTISKSDLRKVFNAHAGAMRKCYERELKRDPRLQGKVKLQVLIRSNGQVGKADVQPVSLQNNQVSNCMERQARTMKFPQPDGGAARVSMPYTFTPEI